MPTQTRRRRAPRLVAEAHSNRDLADLASRMRIGQVCEGGCGHSAAWAAAGPEQVRFGCIEHVGLLLDPQYLWFLHPMGQAA